MSGNDITDLLLEELDKYGLKGEISDRSKHLEIAWETPYGRRFVIAAKTASDWRSGLNTRSDLRKLLRKDNMHPKQESPVSFQRAMSLPKESIVTHASRERAMQRDIETLVELVMELQEQNSSLQQQVTAITEKLNSVSVVSTVMSTVSFAGQQVVEQPVQSDPGSLPKTERVKSNDVVLNCTAYEWTLVSAIIQNTGLGRAVVNQCLMRLREKGLVENGLRGQWRKVAV